MIRIPIAALTSTITALAVLSHGGSAGAAPDVLEAQAGKRVAPRLQTRQQACARYAQGAMQHQRENQRFRCGLAGLWWHGNYNVHYKWCMSPSGRNAGTAARNRQIALRACRVRKVCSDYAKTAVRQHAAAKQANCGFRPPRWSANHTFHYNWCRQGRNMSRARNESWRRRAELNRCRAKRPLSGDFRVVDVRPSVGASGVVQRVSIIVEATSSRPWRVGPYGHNRYGSLWAQVTLSRRYPVAASVRRQSRTYLFSIRGRAAGTAAFVRPHSGKLYPAGRVRFTIVVAPWPRFRLNGVQQVFGAPGSGPISPGSVGCAHHYPEVRARVFIATTQNIARVRGRSRVVHNAPLCLKIMGGRVNIYQRCKKPFGKRC